MISLVRRLLGAIADSSPAFRRRTEPQEPVATSLPRLLEEYVDLVLIEREAGGDASRAPLAAQLADGDPETRGWLLLLALEEIARLRVTLRTTNERLRGAP